MLDVRKLGVTYPGREQPVFTDFSFELTKGNALRLTGPNGSGKTTLLYSLCNVIPQNIHAFRTGDIYLEGKMLNDIPVNMLAPSMMLSMSNPEWELFFPKPIDNIIFTLENLGLSCSDIDSRIAYVDSFFSLDSYEYQKTGKISSGWQKMVALASVAAVNPQVLLLDEPLNGLTEDNIRIVIKWLEDFLVKGGTLVVAELNDYVNKLEPSILSLD